MCSHEFLDGRQLEEGGARRLTQRIVVEDPVEQRTQCRVGVTCVHLIHSQA